MRYFMVIKIVNVSQGNSSANMQVDNSIHMPLMELENALKYADKQNSSLPRYSPFVYAVVSAASYLAASVE